MGLLPWNRRALVPGAPPLPSPPPSAVVALGAYPAKQCPVKTQNRFHPDTRHLASPVDDPFARMLIADGNDFERRVFARLAAESPDGTIQVDEAFRSDARRAATIAAMDDGAPLILAGELPTVDRRTGKPDLLIRCSAPGVPPRYAPGDIKHHLTVTAVDDGLALEISDPARPWPPTPGDARLGARKHDGDLLQLAHYRRMLERLGRAGDEPVAAILGKEEQLVWYRLDAAAWGSESPLDRYDREFQARLDIADAAQTGQATVGPVLCEECAGCEWLDNVCWPALHAGSGHVSLIAGIGRAAAAKLEQAGLTSRQELAEVDGRVADLVADGVDLAGYRAAAFDAPSDLPVDELHLRAGGLSRRPKQLEALRARGVITAGDLLGLPGPIPPPGAAIANQVRLARAAIGPEPVYRRDDTDPGPVPRADIEIDLDMENDPIDGGTYLWGTLLSRPGRQPRYQPFAQLDRPLTESDEADLLAQLWAWLHGVLDGAHQAGHTARIYVWHQSAELTALRRAAALGAGHPHVPTSDQIDQLAASDQWVDLEQEATKRLWLPDGSSIKKVAPLAGHRWPMTDAGGDQSIVWYRTATTRPGPPVLPPAAWRRARHVRRKLLTYNRADVEATLAIRNWLEATHGSLPALR